jgi:beta-phosphoglucomutase
MIKAFIFDMDGTLVDSTQSDFKAWKQILEENSVTLSFTDFLSFLGAKGEEIIKLYLPDQDNIEDLLKKREVYFRKYIDDDGVILIDGAETFLKKIKSHQLKTALATGAGNDKLQFIFEKLDIQKFFDVVLTANDTISGKPNPEIFLTAAKKTGVNPVEAIVVEDSRNGVVAAKNGGFKCIAITSTHTRESLQGADYIIDSFDEINIDDLLHLKE